jgi:predicted PurR-regulated permease PerM
MMMDWTNMYAFGVTHWLVFAVMIAIILYPTGRILTRIGFSPFWSVLALIPFINLIGFWLMAVVDWPEQPRKG